MPRNAGPGGHVGRGNRKGTSMPGKRVHCLPPILHVRPQQEEAPDHFGALFRFGALRPSSSRRRMASERDPSPFAFANASMPL
jgi:hypothetical protein